MSLQQLHPGEIVAETALVKRLLARQFARWATLPLRRLDCAGTDHVIYRLGDEMCVRLPRISWTAGQALIESVWLERIAQRSPLRVPVQLALGEPDCGYPWHWSVCDWIEGENANTHPPADLLIAAEQVAGFIHAMSSIGPAGAPDAVQHDLRGAPLQARDARTRAALRQLDDLVDVTRALRIWEDALDAPQWTGPPRLFHGDLLPGNLIVREGRIVGVIDFGMLGAGDPACDLMSAWSQFGGQSRARFHSAVGADEAMWRRARGHALSQAAMYIPYYRHTNPAGARIALAQLQGVLDDGLRPQSCP